MNRSRVALVTIRTQYSVRACEERCYVLVAFLGAQSALSGYSGVATAEYSAVAGRGVAVVAGPRMDTSIGDCHPFAVRNGTRRVNHDHLVTPRDRAEPLDRDCGSTRSGAHPRRTGSCAVGEHDRATSDERVETRR